MSRVSTAYLLTCAAIGVAGGIMLTAANWLSTALFATVPFISVILIGLWLLPAVVGARLLERPLAAVLVGLISGLVAAPFSGYGFGSVATNLWYAVFVELPFLIVLYRFWKTWQYFVGAIVLGIAYPLLAAASFDLASFPWWGQALFVLLTMASAVAGVALGLAIADALRRTGVARVARRRPLARG